MTKVLCRQCHRQLAPADYQEPCPHCGSMERDGVATEQGVVTDMATKDAVAKDLARKHYQVEPGLVQVFQVKSNAEKDTFSSEPIKLLEINEATVSSGIMPLYFGPAPASGIPFPSIIVEVTPDEFQQIKTRELKLPDGWVHWEPIPRPSGVGE